MGLVGFAATQARPDYQRTW